MQAFRVAYAVVVHPAAEVQVSLVKRFVQAYRRQLYARGHSQPA